MADSIVIQIDDKVSPSISAKIKAIGDSSRAAYADVEKLKSALAGLNSNAMRQMQQSQAQAAAAMDRSALAAQKLATEQQRTAAATASAAAASDKAAAAALRLASAQARASAAASKLAADSKKVTPAVGGAAAAAGTLGKNADLARHHVTNLGFQLNDIGVSLASGQNPLRVFIQQGAQIGQIAAQAGVSLGVLARAAVALIAPFIPLAIAIAAAFGAFKLFTSEVEKNAGLEKYAKSLGATHKQIKELDLGTVTFMDTLKGLWKTFDEGTGAGSFFTDLWKTVKEVFTDILKLVALSVQSIVAMFQAMGAVLTELWARLPVSFKKPLFDFINDVSGAFEALFNLIIEGINKAITAVNEIRGTKIELVSNVSFGKLSTDFAESNGKTLADTFVDSYVTNLKRNEAATKKFLEDFAKNTAGAAKDRIKKTMDELNADKNSKAAESRALALAKINAQLDNELERIGMLKEARDAQAKFDQIEESLISKKIKLTEKETAAIKEMISAIQDNLKIQAAQDAIYAEATGAAERYGNEQIAIVRLLNQKAITEEQAARATVKSEEAYQNALNPLRQYNRDLQQQFELARMLPKEREVEQQIMQVVNQQLAQGNVLSAEKIRLLREELIALQALNAVSSQEASLLSNSVDKREQFINQLKAIQNLRANPKSGFTEGDQATASNDILQGMGLDTTNLQTGLDAKAALWQSYYDKIAEMQKVGLLKDDEAAAYRMQVANMETNARLDQAKGFFGNFEVLSKSSNKKLAAIGKAAAIANAVIDTYKAATGAYASLASIPYIGPALGAAAAAAAIAAGMANVQAIRSQGTGGFMAGGYTGNGARTAVAGAVHGQEYVFDAAATDRIGVANLEAMRTGKTSGAGGMGVNVNIENYGTSKGFEVQQLSPTDIRIIARDEARGMVQKEAPNIVAAQIRNPNSGVSKSLGQNTQTQRRR